jgi:putative ABC transport system permease protein
MTEKSQPQPPSWGTRLILWLGGDSKDVANLLGDLHELYARRANRSGALKARLLYCGDLFSILRHFPFKRIKKTLSTKNYMALLINYVKVAGRNLVRQKLHTGINMIGLSIGLTFSLLISLYVAHELSYDRFHKNGKNIYLLPMTWHFNGTALPTAANCSVGGPFIKEAFAEVDKRTHIGLIVVAFEIGRSSK